MKLIEKMLDHLEDEVDGATEYAEKYLENKAKGDMNRANKFKEMSNDEIKHAGYLFAMDTMDVDDIKKVYQMSADELHAWEHGAKHINEKLALVKQMLTM